MSIYGIRSKRGIMSPMNSLIASSLVTLIARFIREVGVANISKAMCLVGLVLVFVF